MAYSPFLPSGWNPRARSFNFPSSSSTSSSSTSSPFLPSGWGKPFDEDSKNILDTIQSESTEGGLHAYATNDPFRMEFDPKYTYYAMQPQFGASANRQAFFRTQFQNVYNQFMGAQERQRRRYEASNYGDELPALRFQDYIEKPGFFDRQFFATPPSQRFGTQQRVLAPRTRSLYY